MIGLGVNETLFQFAFAQYAVDADSADFGTRAYIYNNGRYKLADDVKFVFDGTNSHIENLHIRAFWDNFDFDTTGDMQGGNTYYNKPNIDPYSIGTKVEIRISGETEPSIETYTRANFNSDVAQWDGLYHPVANLPVVAASAYEMVNNLVDAGVVEYVRDTREIVYANRDGGSASPTEPDQAYILVGSVGADTLTGGSGNDWLLGGQGVDQLYVRGDDSDFVDGGAGRDRADYFDFSGDFTAAALAPAAVPSDIGVNGSAVLSLATNNGGHVDTFRDVEAIYLSVNDNRLIASDSLTVAPPGGGAFDTIVDAYTGTDTLDLSHLTQAADFRGDHFVQNPGLKFVGFEQILGTDNGNYLDLTGTNVRYIQGGSGDDTIFGTGADDVLDGGAGGNDHLIGSATGKNTFVYSGGNLEISSADVDDVLFFRKEFLGFGPSALNEQGQSQAIQIKGGIGYINDELGAGDASLESGTWIYDHSTIVDMGEMGSFEHEVYAYSYMFTQNGDGSKFDFEVHFYKDDIGDLTITFSKTLGEFPDIFDGHNLPWRQDLEGQIIIKDFHNGDLGITFAETQADSSAQEHRYDGDNAQTISFLNNGMFSYIQNSLDTDLFP